MQELQAPTGRFTKTALIAFARRHRVALMVSGAVLVVLGAIYPALVGSLAARAFVSRASARLGRPVVLARGRAGFAQIRLDGLEVSGGGPGRPALVRAEALEVPFGFLLGTRAPVRVRGLVVEAVRGGESDNVSALLETLSARRAGGAEAKGASGGSTRVPGVVIESGSVSLRDAETGLSVTIGSLAGSFLPSDRMSWRLGKIDGILALAGAQRGPRFGATELELSAALEGVRPKGVPGLKVRGGHAAPLPSLALTGISGAITPGMGAAAEVMAIELEGSYGGAREALWTARGRANAAAREGTLSLRAERFSLDKIADVLPQTVLSPARTTVDASVDLKWAGSTLGLEGDLRVAGLSVRYDALASDPIDDVSLGIAISASADLARRTLKLDRLEARIQELAARLSGSVELPAGTYTFADGTKLPVLPRVDLKLEVPRLPCARLLQSIPEALIPKLQGFSLTGTFEAALFAKVDYRNLDQLELGGKVGIDGCRVARVSEAVATLLNATTVLQSVEVPRPLGAPAGETETLQFALGPDNPDWVSYDDISPHLINAIMTTEDNGFFRHRGWVTSQFKAALKRNLARGGFRLGASSITMQMVKNVLLSHEKTLSRKLQELFLVWYLEQVLPKERILELYFNAIEFGPRIYGIGAAARHYFGKPASELTPLEGAFISSILPSPKRRYVQYCHGSLSPQWDKYVRRILAKVNERGRLAPAEYEAAAASTLTFDRTEATFTEKQCLDWVRQMTARSTGSDAPPELDALEPLAEDADVGAWSQRRLKGIFLRGGSRRTAAATKPVVARPQ